jgi:hypothetical protein
VGAIPPQVLEELFTAPPSAFTKERNARAAALKKAGRHDAAEALRRLRRPNASLWATNQLGRLDARRLAAFIDAVGDLRRTQLRDPRAAGEALRRQRSALDALLEVAGKHLADNGLNATPEVLRRISNTLQGAAVDRQRTDELRHGRLTEELSAPGFEVFEGAGPGRLRVVPGGKAETPAHTAERAQARRAAQEARQQRAEEDRQRRAREAEERERAAREQKAAAERAQKEVEDLAGKLAEARRRLSETRRGAKAARKARPPGR